MTKDEAKNISPSLSINWKWHQYVDSFWDNPGWREHVSFIALGFDAGLRAA